MSANPKDDKQGKQQAPQPGSNGQPQQQSGEHGEGNYKATRQYNEGLKEHVQNHDIEKEARDAAPKSDREAQEMEDAERAGKSRARGDGTQSPDDPDNGKT